MARRAAIANARPPIRRGTPRVCRSVSRVISHANCVARLNSRVRSDTDNRCECQIEKKGVKHTRAEMHGTL
jgi:hypothetical protein